MGEVNIEMEKFKEAVIKATTEAGITFQLKDKQIECLKNVVLGRDSVGILPTGYGKTLIYTLLPSILDEYYAKVGHIVVQTMLHRKHLVLLNRTEILLKQQEMPHLTLISP